MTRVDVSDLDASGISLRLPRGDKLGMKTRRLVPLFWIVTVWTVIEELAHINKSTDNTKDAACQSRDDINASDNTPAFRDPNSNPTVEEEYEAFNDEDMYCLSDSNTNSVEVT